MEYTKNEIIFSSGGIKGLLSFGALYKINEIYPLHTFTYYTGTSMGSIIALGLSIGCNLQEMEELFTGLDFIEFCDVRIMNFIEHMGFIDAYKLANLFRAIISYKNFEPNLTFLQLFEQTGKILTIVTTNLTQNKSEFHSYETTPHLSIVQSILMSISIPIVFQPIKYENNLYIDGAVLEHYPYYYRKDTKKVGICILEKNIFEEEEEREYETELTTYLKDIMNLLWNENMKMKFKHKKPKDTLFIIDNQENGFEINTGKEGKMRLVEKGKQWGEMFLQKIYRKRRRHYLAKKYYFLWKLKMKSKM